MKMPPLKQISASFKFVMCDFSKECDFFNFNFTKNILSVSKLAIIPCHP